MTEVVFMPKLSDTMEEGGIASWLKKEGEEVSEGEPLLEIETDKATQEYESPVEGTLLKIIGQPGNTFKLGQPIAVIGEPGDDIEAALAEFGGDAPAEPASAPSPTPPPPAPVSTPSAPTPSTPVAPAAPAVKAGGRVIASPLAKKIAQEQGVDLGSIRGSGPGGRIVAKDLEGASAAPAASGSASTAMPASIPVPAMPGGEDQLIPNSMMRKTIAKRLLAGKNDAPHFYLTVSADMSKLLSWRKRLNANAEKTGIKISVNDLVILATAKALRHHPVVNSSWTDEGIVRFGGVHVAMAVALPEGLVTPVIRNADLVGLNEISRQTKLLGQKAKGGGLKPEEYTGGTFTVSNLGMFGIEEFTAIINPPQAAILAVGTTTSVPWVGEDGEIKAVPRMKMTMSCDHRVVDGATGAQYLQTLVSFLEDPLLMLS